MSKYREISAAEADALYILGVPLQYSLGGLWNDDRLKYVRNPEMRPSLCSTSERWRVEVDR